VLCPGCGGVLDSNATLRTLDRQKYSCALCAAGYEPSLDEMVEVSFTVSPRVVGSPRMTLIRSLSGSMPPGVLELWHRIA